MMKFKKEMLYIDISPVRETSPSRREHFVFLLTGDAKHKSCQCSVATCRRKGSHSLIRRYYLYTLLITLPDQEILSLYSPDHTLWSGDIISILSWSHSLIRRYYLYTLLITLSDQEILSLYDPQYSSYITFYTTFHGTS